MNKPHPDHEALLELPAHATRAPSTQRADPASGIPARPWLT